MSGKCPRCGYTLNVFKDCHKIDDYDVHLWRCPECFNEYVE